MESGEKSQNSTDHGNVENAALKPSKMDPNILKEFTIQQITSPENRIMKIDEYLKSKDGKSLQMALLGQEKDKVKKDPAPLKMLMGNGVTFEDYKNIPNAMKYVMKRDYSKIANLTKEQFRQKLMSEQKKMQAR